MARFIYTATEIESDLIRVAKLVEVRGDVYLPLFEMLERELEKAEKRGSSLNRALLLAQQSEKRDTNRATNRAVESQCHAHDPSKYSRC